MAYVTKEDIEKAKEEAQEHNKALVADVKQDLALVVQQQKCDQFALKLFHDQAAIYTPPPPRDELVAAMRAASPAIHEEIYVDSRRTFHTLLNMAEFSNDKAKVQEVKHRIAERMVPVMQCLAELDPERRYRGCRYGLALALHLVGRHSEALAPVREAIAISRERNKPVPAEYEELQAVLDRLLAPPPVLPAAPTAAPGLPG
jgi:hypothetical protein